MSNILKKISTSGFNAKVGVIETFKEEFMCRVQFSFFIIQLVLSVILNFDFYSIIIILMGGSLVIALELLNTGVENLCDFCSSEYEQLIKRSKDSAAGGVFIISVSNWIIFLLLLIHHFI